MNIDDIPVRTEPGAPAERDGGSGNIPLLLNELRHALTRLTDSGETTCIDLRGLPLAPGELDALQQQLGCGEVRAELDALGRSEIAETDYAGIWRVIHYNSSGEVVGYFLEVTTVPDLLRTPLADLPASIERLSKIESDRRMR